MARLQAGGWRGRLRGLARLRRCPPPSPLACCRPLPAREPPTVQRLLLPHELFIVCASFSPLSPISSPPPLLFAPLDTPSNPKLAALDLESYIDNVPIYLKSFRFTQAPNFIFSPPLNFPPRLHQRASICSRRTSLHFHNSHSHSHHSCTPCKGHQDVDRQHVHQALHRLVRSPSPCVPASCAGPSRWGEICGALGFITRGCLSSGCGILEPGSSDSDSALSGDNGGAHGVEKRIFRGVPSAARANPGLHAPIGAGGAGWYGQSWAKPPWIFPWSPTSATVGGLQRSPLATTDLPDARDGETTACFCILEDPS